MDGRDLGVLWGGKRVGVVFLWLLVPGAKVWRQDRQSVDTRVGEG